MEKNIIFEMLKDLEKDFCLYYGEETINEWKAFYNKWYRDNLSRYQYELELYICKNLRGYLQDLYQTLGLTDEEKTNTFKLVNKTRYRKGLFIGEGSLLPKNLTDYKYIEECLKNEDLITIGHILSNVDNAMDIYSCLESDWRYKTIETRNFVSLISQLKNSKNRKVFDLIFDELCLRDAEFGYSIMSVLENSVKELNDTNVVSIAKSIYIGGKTIRILDKEYNRSSMILDFIKNKKIEKVSTPFVTELLEVISLDNGGYVVAKIIDNLTLEEKEKIRFYSPKTNIKKV